MPTNNLALPFINLVTTNRDQFAISVIKYANKLKFDPNWLMYIMYKESGLNHKAYNPNGGASGLIQFMPATARWLGTTTDALRNMTNVDQLYYVYLYFKPVAGKIHSYEDLYLYVFFPAMVGMSNDTIIQSKNLSADTIAKANPVIDLDKNHVITVGEFKTYAYKGLEQLLKKKG